MSRVLRNLTPRRARTFVIGVVATASLGLLTGQALAAFTVSSLGVAKVTVAGKSVTIVVDNRSVTVYELGGESLKNLQCVTRACFDIWPPVKVSSAGSRVRKAAGVPGTVSILRRVRGGFYQVMLDRHPLYYYSGDSGRKGLAKGDGITSFGGRWHVVKGTAQR
jgi:predicted lipoprotein with Yx(FWY)xxD motif